MVGAPVREMSFSYLIWGWPPDIQGKLNRPRRCLTRREKTFKRQISRAIGKFMELEEARGKGAQELAG